MDCLRTLFLFNTCKSNYEDLTTAIKNMLKRTSRKIVKKKLEILRIIVSILLLYTSIQEWRYKICDNEIKATKQCPSLLHVIYKKVS